MTNDRPETAADASGDGQGYSLFALAEDPGHVAPNGNAGKIFTPVRALRPGEYDELGLAIKTVTNVIQGFMVYMNQALNDLGDSMQRICAETSEMSRDATGPRIELEYRMLNVCAAIKMFEEHTYSEIDRKYGADSVQESEARKIFHETYDGSRSYRILYYLRNAITHGSRNLISFRFVASEGADGSPAYDLRLPLLRDKFADSNARATVRQEVRALPEDPDTLAMSFEVLPVMRTLNQKLMPILEPKLRDRVVTLGLLINEAAAAGGYPMLGSLNLAQIEPPEHGDTVNLPFTLTPIPLPVRDFVATVINSGNVGSNPLT